MKKKNDIIGLKAFSQLSDKDMEKFVTRVKGHILTLCNDAGSGHIGGSLSATRLLSSYFRYILTQEIDVNDSRYNLSDGGIFLPYRDFKGARPFHLSAGHKVPLLYSLYYELGLLSKEEMGSFRNYGGLSGHADTRVQGVPSGLLGQGGGVIDGMAFAEYLESRKDGREPRKIYGIFGGGEMDEGAIWEAAGVAAAKGYNVGFLVDDNGKNLTGDDINEMETYIRAFSALGFEAHSFNSDFPSIKEALETSESSNRPYIISVAAPKGEGVDFMESGPSGFHGSPINVEKEKGQGTLYEIAMEQLGIKTYSFKSTTKTSSIIMPDTPEFRYANAVDALKEMGFGNKPVATRKSASLELHPMMAENNRIVVLYPDVCSSVNMKEIARDYPDRIIDVGIREMGAAGMAAGIAAIMEEQSEKNYLPIFVDFDAFGRIIASYIRMADYGKLPVGYLMTHSEFIGEDGPSHGVSEDMGIWTGLQNINLIANPADDAQMRQALRYGIEISDDPENTAPYYIRASRGGRADIYCEESQAGLPEAGKISTVINSRNGPVIIATGQEVWESMIASQLLKEGQGHTDSTVINVGYIKPFDRDGIYEAIRGSKDVFTVEASDALFGEVAKTNALYGAGAKITPIQPGCYVNSGSYRQQLENTGLSGMKIAELIRGSI